MRPWPKGIRHPIRMGNMQVRILPGASSLVGESNKIKRDFKSEVFQRFRKNVDYLAKTVCLVELRSGEIG